MQCRDMLRNGVHKNRTFLVVDNVTDSTSNIQQAMFFLRVGYCPGSILIVTARSLDQLKGLRIDELSCMEMPELEEVEAQYLFLYHANLCVNEANDKIIKQYVKQCEFRKGDDCGYHYHPLALQVLGVHIGFNFNEGIMANVYEVATFNHSQQTKHPIFQILRKSFDYLSTEDKLLFMDVALFYPRGHWRKGNYLFEWLSRVHQTSVDDVKWRVRL